MDVLDNDSYKEALSEVLRKNAVEDATEHGRLLVMKDALIELTAEKSLDESQLSMFYVKDIIDDGSVISSEELDD